MTQANRPSGGANQPDDGSLTGERPLTEGEQEQGPAPGQSPRAAQQGGMSGPGTGAPTDPTGPTG
jgi:hypothetical protein